ncbi:carbohydrate kinase [Streptomyces spinosirectus]|jgi:sugar (pentulose or hexulose) kinase|uniref:FGGY-family carbohydrate kinase n=1 Tax=Streptomyces TaxID=1883 RepID=UPI000D3731CA|nr:MULTISPECIES: FGGY-family carbohydrate kinase [Streptomyces]MBY8346063.1 carbohydrate kinase [Streptomyces plumbidurans]PTM88281.1 xylulokinase/erythritol kinase [Streptomyces sp. VMFN-G11Ma]UIR18211.1 carbohydrate kinase [Streptomyces spinosirectus]
MYVGIDVGTSMVKAAAFDGDGRELAVEARPVGLALHGGVVEQDMEEVYAAVVAVLAELTSRVAEPVELAGLTGQGDGVWLVDKEGRPVRPAASWMDGRAHELLDQWLADGTFETVFRRTGSAMFPGCPGPLLAWFDRHEPASLDAAAAALYCKDMVFRRLTGAPATTDVSDASMPFLDPRTRAYDNRVVELLGLTHRRGLLAPVGDPIATAEAREGLPPGTRIANGPYDLPSCALGAGVTGPGDGLLIVGTCLASLVATTDLELSGEPAGLYISTDRPGHWLRAMPAMVGTAALDWVLTTTGVRYEEVDALLADTPPGANGVRVLPYFAPSGERAPFVEPRLRAELTGVSLESTRADLIRATCEGIGFAARHCLDAAGLTGSLAVCGGGTRSPAWMRLLADVLGRPLKVVEGEVGARGAVLAAAERYGVALDAAAWTEPTAVVEPDAARSAYYARAYEDHLARLAQARGRART